jgi:hypothetical protein
MFMPPLWFGERQQLLELLQSLLQQPQRQVAGTRFQFDDKPLFSCQRTATHHQSLVFVQSSSALALAFLRSHARAVHRLVHGRQR